MYSSNSINCGKLKLPIENFYNFKIIWLLLTDQFNKDLNLSQMIKRPAGKNNILDKIFTNCSTLYASPIIYFTTSWKIWS